MAKPKESMIKVLLTEAEAELVSQALSQKVKSLDKIATTLMKERQVESAKLIYDQMKMLSELESKLSESDEESEDDK